MLVGEVVENSVAHTTQGSETETRGDTSRRAIVDSHPREKGIEAVVEDGGEPNDGQRVEVVDNVVGHAVSCEHGGEEAGRVADTVVVKVLDGEEAEDSGSLEGTLDVFDELIVPASRDAQARSCDVGRLRQVPETMASNPLEAATSEANAQNTEDVGKVAAAWWVENQPLTKVPEQERERDVKDKREEEGQPPADILLEVGGRNAHETTDIDEQVEPQHSPLGSSLGIFDDTLAILQGLDDGDLVRHLVKEQGRDIRLE